MNNKIVRQQIDPEDEIYKLAIVADPDMEPISFVQLRQDLGIYGEPIETKMLVDRTFTITRAKPFASAYKDGAHAWYCVVKPEDTAVLNSVVLGGGACVEFLDAYARSGDPRPLKVILRYNEGGGRHDGYYFFE